MANIRRFELMRNAIAKPLVITVGLACASMQVAAFAQKACDCLNYDESKVGDYTVPDPLLSQNGKRVTDATSWRANRRNEILRDFRDLMYGHTPELPVKLRAQVVATRRDALGGLATRTTVKLHCFDDPKAPRIELMYLRTRGRELSTQDQVDHAALRWARNWNLAMRCSDRDLINPD